MFWKILSHADKCTYKLWIIANISYTKCFSFYVIFVFFGTCNRSKKNLAPLPKWKINNKKPTNTEINHVSNWKMSLILLFFCNRHSLIVKSYDLILTTVIMRKYLQDYLGRHRTHNYTKLLQKNLNEHHIQ